MGASIHYQIDPSDTPIRLFKSDFLEFFTHIKPGVVAAIYTPAIVVALYIAVVRTPVGVSLVYVPPAFVCGLFLWTLLEYMLHRFLFHMQPHGATMKRVSFLFHGVHHTQPRMKTRLVMPPVVSIPITIMFGIVYWLALRGLGAEYWMPAVFAGSTTGYLTYDMTHYGTHHWSLKWGYLQYIRRYHMKHHFKKDDAYFGVTSPAWDYVFGTIPAADRRDFSTQ